MALEKVVSVDLIEVVENGTLQVRTKQLSKKMVWKSVASSTATLLCLVLM